MRIYPLLAHPDRSIRPVCVLRLDRRKDTTRERRQTHISRVHATVPEPAIAKPMAALGANSTNSVHL